MIIRRLQFDLLGKTVLGNLVFTPPFKASSALHNEARFMHVVRGKSRLYSPEGQLDLVTGDSVLMRCENFVNNWLENEGDENNEVVVFQLYPEILDYVYDGKIPALFSSGSNELPNSVERIHANDMMDNYVRGMLYYLNNESLITDELLKIKLQELILVLVNSDRSGQMKTILGDLFRTKEHEFKAIIRSHLFEDLKLEDLAFFTGLSLSSFKRKFNAVFGTSPIKYIKTKRLEKAVGMLKMSDERISDIAFDCGFNDLSYFSKSFASVYECSPSEYRKKNLG
jgi:AraC-like DNA-binding protein